MDETMSAAGIARYADTLRRLQTLSGSLPSDDIRWCLRAITWLLAELERERNRAL